MRISAPGPAAGVGGTPLPVLPIDPGAFSRWAKMISGERNSSVYGVNLLQLGATSSSSVARNVDEAWDADDPKGEKKPPDPRPRDRLFRFGASASGPARRLATYLATVPLSLPVMRLVQLVMLPESRHVHLAEFLLSGLVERVGGEGESAASDGAFYEFVDPAIRDLLLEGMTASEVHLVTERVTECVSRFIAQSAGYPTDFSVRLADPTGLGTLSLPPGSRSFARIAANALRRFGGEHAALAERLDAIHPSSVPEPSDAPLRVLVAGSGTFSLPTEVLLPARLLGEQLALAGYGLISGGWPGVDHVVARAFIDKLVAIEKQPTDLFSQVVESGRKNDFVVEGAKVDIRDDWAEYSVAQADLVVLIGGLGGTSQIFETAIARRKPVIPISGSGGDAANAMKDLLLDHEWRDRTFEKKALQMIRSPVGSESAAQLVIDGVINLIRLHSDRALQKRYREFCNSLLDVAEKLGDQGPESDPAGAVHVPFRNYLLLLSEAAERPLMGSARSSESITSVEATAKIEPWAKERGDWLLADLIEVSRLSGISSGGSELEVAILRAFLQAGEVKQLVEFLEILGSADPELHSSICDHLSDLSEMVPMIEAERARLQSYLNKTASNLGATNDIREGPPYAEGLDVPAETGSRPRPTQWEGEPSPDSDDWALVIGIDRFENFVPLRGSASDARSFGNWLASPGGGGVPLEQIKILTGHVSVAEIRAGLAWLSEANRSNTSRFRRAYVYIATYGFRERQDHVIAGSDTEPPSSATYLEGYVYLDLSQIENEYREIVAILDVAFTPRPAPLGRPREVSRRLDRELKVSKFLVSCQRYGEESWTSGILKGLAGAAANPDGQVTAISLAKYLEEISPEMTTTDNFTQRPSVDFTGSTDIVLARDRARPTMSQFGREFPEA
ncbi:hypothetical protein NKJ31_29975 [Mesorhizobium sp. M0133]